MNPAELTRSSLTVRRPHVVGLVLTIVLLFFVLIGLAVFAMGQFNKLRTLDLQAQGAFAGIDTLLTKRADLIPNLVATVKGASDFEKGTLEAVVSARTSAVQASTVQDKALADNMMTQALGRLFALAEAYPQLTATQNYQDLQAELSRVEGELQFARQFYNDSVVTLNTACKTIPSMWFTGLAKVTERDLYSEPDADRRKAPTVEF